MTCLENIDKLGPNSSLCCIYGISQLKFIRFYRPEKNVFDIKENEDMAVIDDFLEWLKDKEFKMACFCPAYK